MKYVIKDRYGNDFFYTCVEKWIESLLYQIQLDYEIECMNYGYGPHLVLDSESKVKDIAKIIPFFINYSNKLGLFRDFRVGAIRLLMNCVADAMIELTTLPMLKNGFWITEGNDEVEIIHYAKELTDAPFIGIRNVNGKFVLDRWKENGYPLNFNNLDNKIIREKNDRNYN